jgi:RecA-family ATPase
VSDEEIRERQSAIDELHAELFGAPSPASSNGHRPVEPVDLDDQALLERAMTAANGAKFSALWRGDTGGYASHSEADAGLALLLAWWTGRDVARMDSLFRQSGLMRAKWDTRRGDNTYGTITLARAAEQCSETYQAPREQPPADDREVLNAPDGPVLVRLADVGAESVEWIWPSRIARGKLALLIGEAGEGKSYVTHDLSARLTRAMAWPDGGRAPVGVVVILAHEDGIADTVRPRVDRQGGDAGRVYLLRGVRVEGHERAFSFERDLVALEQALVQTRAIALVVDPISAYLGSRDSYKDSEIRGILAPLAELAERHRVAVIAILHLTKAAQRKVLLRAQGSVAFVAQARTVLAVAEDREMPGRRLLVSVKNNLGPMAPALAFRISEAGLAWDEGTVTGTAEKLLAVDEATTRSDQRERDEAVTFLRDLLGAGAMQSRQIMADAKANGISQRTLWRAKSELGIIAERAKGQTGAWYWMLPAGSPS